MEILSNSRNKSLTKSSKPIKLNLFKEGKNIPGAYDTTPAKKQELWAQFGL
jgi:hypothetical protein